MEKYKLDDIGVFDGRNFVIKDPKIRDRFELRALVVECPEEQNDYGYYLPLLYIGGMLIRKGSKRKLEPGDVVQLRFSRYEKKDRISVL